MRKLLQGFITTFILTSITISATAQKGMPAKKIVDINHATNYAQHVDFKDSLVQQLKTARGWKVKVAAKGLGKPRMLLANDSGHLYITRRDAGDVLLLKDSNGDHVFDDLKTVISEFKGVHGITRKGNWLYLCNNRELKRYHLQTDGSVGEAQLLMKDLPDGGQHGNRTMHFGPDGKLYLSVGSTCNDCVETNKENGTMLQIDTSSWTRVIFARGLRNTIGFDWHPVTKELYGLDNGGDAKGDNWPPEELNHIKKDSDYGWPFVYGKQEVDETREDPPGITKDAYAKNTIPSLLEFPAHMAPIDFAFIDEKEAIVCWHGSWNKREPDGFKVQAIQFNKNSPSNTTDFLDGFFNKEARTRFGRPAGIAVVNKNLVYISDDANGIIYCMERTSL